MSQQVLPLQVAVGIVESRDGDILIAKRLTHVPQGGLWEFPGGKLEAGEDSLTALSRELQEEVGIAVQNATPLVKITHHYSQGTVVLDTWHVTAFTGEAAGLEGQQICWVKPQALAGYTFPAANIKLIKAIWPDFITLRV